MTIGGGTVNFFSPAAVSAWALEVAGEFSTEIINREHLDRIRLAESAAATSRMRTAMARLPAAVFATALIHHGSPATVPVKYKLIRRATGEEMSRRQYWNQLDRANYFAAGVLAARPRAGGLELEELMRGAEQQHAGGRL